MLFAGKLTGNCRLFKALTTTTKTAALMVKTIRRRCILIMTTCGVVFTVVVGFLAYLKKCIGSEEFSFMCLS